MALPFRTVPGDAAAAKRALTAAKDAALDGDTATAQEHVAVARTHVDSLQDSTQGLGGTVWSWVPVASGPVRDVRHLGDALSDLTDVAETGVGTWSRLNGTEQPLMSDEQIDLGALRTVAVEAREIDRLLTSATASLDAVADDRLVGGTMFADARDEALDVAVPLARTVDSAVPLLDQLPATLGAEKKQKYLVTMLNQSEQRHSGGAGLTLATLTADDGRIELGEPVDATDGETFERLNWKPVRGNIFHRPDSTIAGATYAPSWSVSGPEVARAWQKLRGQRIDGVIAVDLTALADLLDVTGPVKDTGFGTLTGDNLVREVIGNYDPYEGDTEGRKELNRELVPLFADLVFDSSQLTEKLTSLHDSAEGRHFAVWMRSEETQALVADAGLAGDLTSTDHDYLAVSNQNTNAAKSDFWLRRDVSSRVRVAADGSARVRVTVQLHNDSPPWPFSKPDPEGSSFVTRWNGMSQAVFVPKDATGFRATLGGVADDSPWVDTFFDHQVVRADILLSPGARETYVLEYRVPAAAVVGDDGELAYGLVLDPHTLVQAEGREVTVEFPDSMSVTGLPKGWTVEGNVARYAVEDLTKTEEFTVTAAP
ncbi:MAG: DUF4012 domain-containing protein [Nocardioides sp.]|uniref:DUF4012 domain-containing protein n=1 Tax=Nocardioides sp. TaxID=35761 RepID=UPI003F122AC7